MRRGKGSKQVADRKRRKQRGGNKVRVCVCWGSGVFVRAHVCVHAKIRGVKEVQSVAAPVASATCVTLLLNIG